MPSVKATKPTFVVRGENDKKIVHDSYFEERNWMMKLWNEGEKDVSWCLKYNHSLLYGTKIWEFNNHGIYMSKQAHTS